MGDWDKDLEQLNDVVAVLDRLQIRYAVGGSVASSIHGVPRFTNDVDLGVEPFPGRERDFAAHFSQRHYVSVPAIVEANQKRRSFNVIDPGSGFKADLFVLKDRLFDASAMQRRVPFLAPGQSTPLMIYSPEDIILLKLEWFEIGDRTSQRQWNDVLGVMRSKHGVLDQAYLRRMATDLAIDDLLDQSLVEAIEIDGQKPDQ